MDEVKRLLKTLFRAVVGVGGVLAFVYGVMWAAEQLLGKPPPSWLVLLAALILSLCIAMVRLILVAEASREKDRTIRDLSTKGDQLAQDLSQAIQRAGDAEKRTERVRQRARAQLQAASAENLRANLMRSRAHVESAQRHTQIRQQWDAREVRVLSVKRGAGPDGEALHVATLNVGSLHGAVPELAVEVASGDEPVAYGSVAQVADDKQSLAILQPYDLSDNYWTEVSADLDDFGEHVPQGWIVSLSDRQPWSDLDEGHLAELREKLTAAIECVERVLSGGAGE